MIRRDVEFGCADSMTPDIAVKLVSIAERSTARLDLACGGKRVCLDSLIGILSVECRRGTRVEVLAEGDGAEADVDAIVELLEGR